MTFQEKATLRIETLIELIQQSTKRNMSRAIDQSANLTFESLQERFNAIKQGALNEVSVDFKWML